MSKYWERIGLSHAGLGVKLEARAAIALTLIEGWGLVTGHRDEESDPAGRRTIDVMPADQTVARAFALADRFMEVAEERGDVLPITREMHDEASHAIGELEHIKQRAAFPRTPEAEAATAARLERLRNKVKEEIGAEPAST